MVLGVICAVLIDLLGVLGIGAVLALWDLSRDSQVKFAVGTSAVIKKKNPVAHRRTGVDRNNGSIRKILSSCQVV